MTGITPPDVRFSRASNMHQRGRLAEAIALYQEALDENPSHLGALNQLGIAFFQARKFQEAIAVLRQALKINPGQSGTRYNLGTILQSSGRYEEAANEFREAILQNPGDPELHNNLGVALKSLDRYQEAATSYRKAVALKPGSAEYRINLASTLFLLEQYEESLLQSEKALVLRPDLAEAHLGYGRALQSFHRYEEALSHIEKSLQINPDQEEAIYNKFCLCLSVERFSEGWQFFEINFIGRHRKVSRAHSSPAWDGKGLGGVLAVWGDQGLGDQVLYASMIPDVLANVESLVLEVEPRLIDLFSRSFPEIKVCSLAHDPGTINAQANIRLPRLGNIYRRNIDDFPRRAYLKADKSRAVHLRDRLESTKTTKWYVGISWRSINPEFGNRKTADIRDFYPLLASPDVRAVDLQYDDTTFEIASVQGEFGISITHLDEINNTNDIDGLAALIEACDAVVTISNTTAHIAGALGKPVWILVPYHGHGQLWYWFKDRTDSLWYPHARICRQQKGQSWQDLIASVTPEIVEFLQKQKESGR